MVNGFINNQNPKKMLSLFTYYLYSQAWFVSFDSINSNIIHWLVSRIDWCISITNIVLDVCMVLRHRLWSIILFEYIFPDSTMVFQFLLFDIRLNAKRTFSVFLFDSLFLEEKKRYWNILLQIWTYNDRYGYWFSPRNNIGRITCVYKYETNLSFFHYYPRAPLVESNFIDAAYKKPCGG